MLRCVSHGGQTKLSIVNWRNEEWTKLDHMQGANRQFSFVQLNEAVVEQFL